MKNNIINMTESNTNNISSCDYLKYKKLTKFNKFYLSSNNLFKNEPLIKSPSNINHLFITRNPMTPFKLTRTTTQSNLANSVYLNSTLKSNKTIYNSSFNSNKIKNKFNPDLLDTQYISLSKKRNKKISLDIPSRNTFLGNKIKTKTLNLNTFNYINGNKYKIISSSFFKNPIINKHIIDIKIKNKLCRKKNDSNCEPMKRLIEKANKSCKKANAIMINKFEKRFIYDKRENLKEYNNFMNELTTNLNLSKSKSKINKLNF